MIAIADTGFVLAVANPKDKHHNPCLEVYDAATGIYLPQSVLAELGYLLTKLAGKPATVRFLLGLAKTKYALIALEPEDIVRTANLLNQYLDTRLDFVDASVVAVAERLRIGTILTIDRRDFSMIRPAHADYFQLLPEKLP